MSADYAGPLRELLEAEARRDAAHRETREAFDGLTRGTCRIAVNKRTHCIRFEGETEDAVTIVIEKREG